MAWRKPAAHGDEALFTVAEYLAHRAMYALCALPERAPIQQTPSTALEAMGSAMVNAAW